MLYEDFITKREIKMYFPTVSNYHLNKLIMEVKEYCEIQGINIFNKRAVPTRIFCDYWGLDYDKFIKTIRDNYNSLQSL